MFDALKRGFKEAQNRLAGLTELNEKNIAAALSEVRVSLIDADVELGVVKRFLARVEEGALGKTVQVRAKSGGQTLRATAGEQFIKLCHDELIAMMDSDREPLVYAAGRKPTSILMVGLQGSGKTTTTAKLARWLRDLGRTPMLVAADMQRPAAVEQLKVLGEGLGVPVFNLPGETPLAICKAAPDEAKRRRCDVIIYDTAGRLAIDEALMEELSAIKSAVEPENILLVIDAMIGQDSVRTARAFNERLGISGVVLTKLDGDARGGAALSVKEVTGAPILFAGMGETTDKLERFRAEGMAGRILGMGDVVGLIQDFEEVIDQKKAEESAARMMSGDFTLDDFLEQIRMIQSMGSVRDLIDKIPGLGGMLPPGANIDEGEFGRAEAMIQSMTREERSDPNALVREPKRVKRVARGSGRSEQQVLELVQKFLFMKSMMGNFGQQTGLLGKIPGMKGLSMAKNMRRAMKGGGMPGMGFPPGMGMPGMGFPPGMGMPGMGFPPGMGMPGLGMQAAAAPKMRALTQAEKNAKKQQRRSQKTARKRGR